MNYSYWYENEKSPVGRLYLTADDTALTGCWFDGHQRFFAYTQQGEHAALDRPATDALEAAAAWLDVYFEGRDPGALPPVNPQVTPFRKQVCDIMARIPFGETVTYGDIAREISQATGKKMSSQAVGGAVGHNPIGVIIPCHRVVGASGSLIGYGGGIDRKIALLELEGVDMSRFTVPTKGTAL